MVELFLETPLELKIILFGVPVAWFVLMYLDKRAEKKRQRLRRVDVIRPDQKKLRLVKK